MKKKEKQKNTETKTKKKQQKFITFILIFYRRLYDKL